MLDGRKLILDTFCEVYDQLKPWADYEFWDFSKHAIVPNAIYLVGRAQFNLNRERIKEIIRNKEATIIFSNPAEGSETIKWQMIHAGIDQFALDGSMLVIGGGDMEDEYHYLRYDSFLPKVLDYDENVKECSRTQEIYEKVKKPYKFLFLNGRARPHRKYLLQKFRLSGLLDQCLWTNLDTFAGKAQEIKLVHHGQDLMLESIPVKLLPAQYEVTRYNQNLQNDLGVGFIKNQLFDFNNSLEWGEIYLTANPYIDTYFSLVTETVFTYPYSFRTEKIWKPIAIGHPWIAVANQGYYQDLHNLGFRSFGKIIDESFDNIENNLDRLQRINTIVEDICKSSQNLISFLDAAQDTCLYNQQRYQEARLEVREEFANRFFNFLITNNIISERPRV